MVKDNRDGTFHERNKNLDLNSIFRLNCYLKVVYRSLDRAHPGEPRAQ